MSWKPEGSTALKQGTESHLLIDSGPRPQQISWRNCQSPKKRTTTVHSKFYYCFPNMHSISSCHFLGVWKMQVWMLGWEISALIKYSHFKIYTEFQWEYQNSNVRFIKWFTQILLVAEQDKYLLDHINKIFIQFSLSEKKNKKQLYNLEARWISVGNIACAGKEEYIKGKIFKDTYLIQMSN